MKENFYTTKAIAESLDMRLLINIQTLIASMEKDADYLQIFTIEGDKLTHSQEIPGYRQVYRLHKKYKEDKIFAIRTEEEKRSYWTIMFCSEY
jgi:uroporphyrinogen-III decarboxylase